MLGFKPQQFDGLRIYGSVTNLLDRGPPQTPQAIGRTGVFEFGSGLHDSIGRRYVLGAEYSF